MIRTYYIELEGVKCVCGEAWVEVEEVLYGDGSVNEEATVEAARDAAFRDVNQHKIDWETYNGDVEDVEIVGCSRD